MRAAYRGESYHRPMRTSIVVRLHTGEAGFLTGVVKDDASQMTLTIDPDAPPTGAGASDPNWGGQQLLHRVPQGKQARTFDVLRVAGGNPVWIGCTLQPAGGTRFVLKYQGRISNADYCSRVLKI